jgi:hypothetical protein
MPYIRTVSEPALPLAEAATPRSCTDPPGSVSTCALAAAIRWKAIASGAESLSQLVGGGQAAL